MSKGLQSQKYSSILGFEIQQDKEKPVYIYAQVDIDKLYQQITSKGKKIHKFVEDNNLQASFLEKMKEYKHLVDFYVMKRICFDNEIQQFIHKKELNKQLKNVKKNVFNALEDFLITKFADYLEEQRLHKEYEQKVREIEGTFEKRLKQLMKDYV